MILALFALTVASIADALTTRAGIRTGLLRETNPLMRWFTRTTTRAVGIKFVALALAGWQVVTLAATHPVLALAIVWLAVILPARLAWQNYLLHGVVRDDALPE